MSTSIAVVKKLKMSKSTAVSRSSSSDVGSQLPLDNGEDIKLLHKDLKILEKKITEVQGQPIHPESSSAFVAGVRSHVENSSAMSDNRESSLRLQLFEKIVLSVGELDREVLKKTAPIVASRARRNSRGGGQDSDLHLLPTHLTIVDRLMDFHTQLLREQPVPVLVAQQSVATGREEIETSALENELGASKSEISRLSSKVDAMTVELERLKKEVSDRPPSVPVQELEKYKDMARSMQEKWKECNGLWKECEAKLEVLRDQEAAVLETINVEDMIVEQLISNTPQIIHPKQNISDLNKTMVCAVHTVYNCF